MSDARQMFRAVQRLLAPLRGAVRGMIRRGAIGTLNASGKGQTLQAQTTADDADDEVELFEPYGFTSGPPPGSECLVLRVGGERAKSVALAAGDRSTRPAGIAQGEVAMYHHNGLLLVLRNDTSVELVTPQGATVTVSPAGAVDVFTASGQTVNLGAAGGLAVARATDPVAPGDPMGTWAGVVETAINALAPGTFTPANNFPLSVAAVPGGFGEIAAGGQGSTST